MSMNWNEQDHPRDNDGKFTDKGAGAPKKIEYRQNTPYEKILADDRAREAERAKAPKSAPPFSPMKSGKDFKDKLLAAKEQIDERARWRVSSDYSASDYEAEGVKLYASGDSVYALKPHGKGYDIVSVCVVRGKGATGHEILADAVAKGGDRLDAFGKKLYDFYTRNGFAPVSWTPFNAEYAPDDWKSAKAHGFVVQEEPVIFYKYTGKSTPYAERTYEEFLQTVKPDEGADGYDNAMRKRDQDLDNTK